jgi:hypothetical protein
MRCLASLSSFFAKLPGIPCAFVKLKPRRSYLICVCVCVCVCVHVHHEMVKSTYPWDILFNLSAHSTESNVPGYCVASIALSGHLSSHGAWGLVLRRYIKLSFCFERYTSYINHFNARLHIVQRYVTSSRMSCLVGEWNGTWVHEWLLGVSSQRAHDRSERRQSE